MSVNLTTDDNQRVWLNSDGEKVDIPDSYNTMSEYVCSVLEAARFSTIQTRMGFFGHDDVTLKIESKDGEQNVKLTLEIQNWREYTGGESPSTDFEYMKGKNSDQPASRMRKNGAFYHKIQSKLPTVFDDNYDLNNINFELESFGSKEVIYSTTLSLN